MGKEPRSRMKNRKINLIAFSSIVLVVILILLSAMLDGGVIKEKLESKKLEEYKKEVRAERFEKIGNYIEAYLEKKYNEEFENVGLDRVSSYHVDDIAIVVSFKFKSTYTGYYFVASYKGKYANAMLDDDIVNGYVDELYYYKRKAFEFKKHEQSIIDDFFPGKKMNYYITYGLDEGVIDRFYKNVDLIEEKYFDIDYILEEEKKYLDDYYVSFNYFRDVYPENKDEMLEDIYSFLMYTRSLGFKRCHLEATIFEESVMESEEYKEYVEGDKGTSMSISLGIKGVRTVNIIITNKQFDTIEKVDDLKQMTIFSEIIDDDGYNNW